MQEGRKLQKKQIRNRMKRAKKEENKEKAKRKIGKENKIL